MLIQANLNIAQAASFFDFKRMRTKDCNIQINFTPCQYE